MKKLLLITLMLIGIVTSSFAEVQYYKTTAFASATVLSNGAYVWGSWEKSNMNLTIDTDNDVITIFSPSTQRYIVVSVANNGQAYIDASGGKNIKFFVVDQDGDRGTIRLRIERNGNSQIYIDFSDVAWVYNVVRYA